MNKMNEKLLNKLNCFKIVEELDKFIIGQHDAKRAVSIALRNRNRRECVEDSTIKTEIAPKNILMVGPCLLYTSRCV